MVSAHLEQIVSSIYTNQKPLVILGPTASGKSALAHSIYDQLELKNIRCHIINLDAFQIYKELNAGTAKPSAQEQAQYRYHGIDLCKVTENMDANTFSKKMRVLCDDLTKQGHFPICVGGSGLYLRAFLHGLDDLPQRDEKIRDHIQKRAQEHGWPWCHQWLAQVDPTRAAELHPNDKTRIERALEIFLLSGKPASALRSKTNILASQDMALDCFVLHIKPQADDLKERISLRVHHMLQQGWIQEVQNLLEIHGENLKSYHAMCAIGYLDVLSFLTQQDMNLDELRQIISTKTWQYAKRQMTWNAKEKIDFLSVL